TSLVICEPIDDEVGDLCPSYPRRLEFRPELHDQQHPKCPNSVYGTTKRLQAGWVSPMRILEDHKHRSLPRQRLDLRGERVQRFLPALMRHQFEGVISAIVRQRKHLGNECGVLDRGRSLREQSIELVELPPGRIVV